jgi:hypothetical protein
LKTNRSCRKYSSAAPPTGSARTLLSFKAVANRLVIFTEADGLRMAIFLGGRIPYSPHSLANARKPWLADC